MVVGYPGMIANNLKFFLKIWAHFTKSAYPSRVIYSVVGNIAFEAIIGRLLAWQL